MDYDQGWLDGYVGLEPATLDEQYLFGYESGMDQRLREAEGVHR